MYIYIYMKCKTHNHFQIYSFRLTREKHEFRLLFNSRIRVKGSWSWIIQVKCVIETNRKRYSVGRIKSNDLVWQTVDLSIVFRTCNVPWFIFFFSFLKYLYGNRVEQKLSCKKKIGTKEENFESRSRKVYPKFKVLLKSYKRHV